MCGTGSRLVNHKLTPTDFAPALPNAAPPPPPPLSAASFAYRTPHSTAGDAKPSSDPRSPPAAHSADSSAKLDGARRSSERSRSIQPSRAPRSASQATSSAAAAAWPAGWAAVAAPAAATSAPTHRASSGTRTASTAKMSGGASAAVRSSGASREPATPAAPRKSTMSAPRAERTAAPSAPRGRSESTALQVGSTGSQKAMWLAPRRMQSSARPLPGATPSAIVRRSVSVASPLSDKPALTPSSEPPKRSRGGGRAASHGSTDPRSAKAPIPELTSDAPYEKTAATPNGSSNEARSRAVRPPDEWPPTARRPRSRRPARGPSEAAARARSSSRIAAMPAREGPRL
mmetsp:Transcript_47436/g.152606  ORF Transcript_47436/g.152606 Transcript_47436/m.152606 type:complete len:345 (-) Transcript_47436:136-1170(-)